jgi:hypothetical protein
MIESGEQVEALENSGAPVHGVNGAPPIPLQTAEIGRNGSIESARGTAESSDTAGDAGETVPRV